MGRTTRFLLKSIFFSLSINIFFIFVGYFAFTEGGSQSNLMFGDIVLIFAALCLVAFPISLLSILFRKLRSASLSAATFSFTFFIISVFGVFVSAEIRDSEFEKLAKRSTRLVESINDFEKKNGRLPRALNELVPDYFNSIPKTKMGAYPEYVYLVGDEASKFEDNRWVILVHASNGLLNWDLFMYFPMKNYPQDGYGGYIERMHDWAYVYE